MKLDRNVSIGNLSLATYCTVGNAERATKRNLALQQPELEKNATFVFDGLHYKNVSNSAVWYKIFSLKTIYHFSSLYIEISIY